MEKALKNKTPIFSREPSRMEIKCMEVISTKIASMKETLKMMNSMEKENCRIKTAAFIMVLSATEDSTGMESSNGQMVRNIEEITIMGNGKEMASSSTPKIRASRREYGAKGC
jgi:hypothetical protein